MGLSTSKTDDSLIQIKILIAVLVGTPALALGAVHVSIAGTYFALSAVLLFYLFGRRTIRAPIRDLPTVAAFGLIGFTLLQIIPLPATLVKFLAPSVFAVRQGSLSPLHIPPPDFMSLSLDVPLTVMELGKLTLYLSVYWGVHHLVRHVGSRFVLQLITALGIIAAAILLTHKILLLQEIFGFYKPLHVSFTEGRISAPLINENHMAALLGMCTAAIIGYALGQPDRTRRAAALGAATFVGGAMMLTLSRGGIVAFFAGQCVFIAVRLSTRRKHSDHSAGVARLAWLPVGLAAVLGLGMFAAQDAIWGEFQHGNLDKTDLFLEGLPLIGRFWSTGVGRGAFQVGIHLVGRLSTDLTMTHAENALLQLLSDWGVPVGGAAVLVSVIIVGRLLRKPPHRIEYAAALAALVAFGVHNLVDFNMEIIGVAAPAAALLGMLMGNDCICRRTVAAQRIDSRFVLVAGCLAVGCAAAAFAYVRPHSIDTEAQIYHHALFGTDEGLFTDEALASVLARHPTDARIPYLVGVRTYHLEKENPLPWLARAVALAPQHANAHFYIGGTLLRAGRLDQAMLELRLAARSKPGLAVPAARLLVSRVPSFARLSKIAVTQKDKLLLWPALAAVLYNRGNFGEAVSADNAVLKINPEEPRTLVRRIRRELDDGDLAAARESVEILAKNPRFGPTAVLLDAEIWEKEQDLGRAEACLTEGAKQYDADPMILEKLAWIRLKRGNFDGALLLAATLKSRAATSTERAKGALLEARLYAADNRIRGALAKLREARALDPENLDILRKTYQLADRYGDAEHAVEALRLLLRRFPDDASLRNAMSKYENRLNPQDSLHNSDKF